MAEKRNSSRIYKVLILAAILALPGFLYYLLENKGENRYKALPIYGEKQLTGTFTSRMGEQIPDTLYHAVPQIELLNQQDSLVLIPALDSAISIVNVFYTRCESFCTHMNDEMNRVADRFINNNKVRFYTISIDTLYDTSLVLANYGSKYTPESKKWQFLTGNSSERDVLDFVRSGLLVDAFQDTTKEATFVHSSSLILLDSEHRIRGYYDVNHRKEVDRLIDEIKLLLVEEVRERSPY